MGRWLGGEPLAVHVQRWSTACAPVWSADRVGVDAVPPSASCPLLLQTLLLQTGSRATPHLESLSRHRHRADKARGPHPPPLLPTPRLPRTAAAAHLGAVGRAWSPCSCMSHLVSYEHMGRASVTCVSGCACQPALLEGHDGGSRHSVPVMLRMLVSRSSSCVVQLEVLPGSSSGGHKVKLLAAVVSTLRNATADVLALIGAAEAVTAAAASGAGAGGGARRTKQL